MAAFVQIDGKLYELNGVLTPVEQMPPQAGQEVALCMSSSSSGGFTASATTEYAESGVVGAAWRAFDGVAGAGWATGWSSAARATVSTPQILTLLFAAPTAISSYKLQIRSDANNLAPTDWVVEGLLGTTWTQLASSAGLTWTNGEEKTFSVTAPGVLAGLRWRFTGSGVLCQVQRIRIFA